MVAGLTDSGRPVDEPSTRSIPVTLEVSDDGTPTERAPLDRHPRARTPRWQLRLLRQAPGLGCVYLLERQGRLRLCLVPPAGAAGQWGGRATSGLSACSSADSPLRRAA